MVTFLKKQSGYIRPNSPLDILYTENPGECFINPRAVNLALYSLVLLASILYSIKPFSLSLDTTFKVKPIVACEPAVTKQFCWHVDLFTVFRQRPYVNMVLKGLAKFTFFLFVKPSSAQLEMKTVH